MTVLVTGRAVPALFILLIRITWAAYIRLITSETMFAGVVFHVPVSDPGEYKMIPDLFWNGGRIFVQSLRNLGKRAVFIKHFPDDCTLFEWEMFLVRHVSTSILPGHSTNTISHEKVSEKDEEQEWNTIYKWIKIAAAVCRGKRFQCQLILFDGKASENIRSGTKRSTPLPGIRAESWWITAEEAYRDHVFQSKFQMVFSTGFF